MRNRLTLNNQLSDKALADIAVLKDQLAPLTDLGLAALRRGLEERNPACIKLWLDYKLLLAQLEKNEQGQGNGRFIQVSENLFLEI